MVVKHRKVSTGMKVKEMSKAVAMDTAHSGSQMAQFTREPGKKD